MPISHNRHLILASVRSCPSLLRMPPQDVIGAWVMKENGIPESSVKFSLRADRLGSVSLKPSCYTGEDKDQVLVLVKDVNMLLVCNLKEQTKKVMLVND